MISLLIVALLNISAAAEPWPTAFVKGSQGSKESHESIIADLKEWGLKNRDQVSLIEDSHGSERKKFLSLFNSWLKERGLPQINLKGPVKIKRTCMVGFAPEPNCFHGFEIEDGSLRFCYPCMPQYNYMAHGILPATAKVEPEEEMPTVILENQPKKSKAPAPGKK